jgi:hypothetical protein
MHGNISLTLTRSSKSILELYSNSFAYFYWIRDAFKFRETLNFVREIQISGNLKICAGNLNLATDLQGVDASEVKCPRNWVQFRQSCYKFTRSPIKRWDDARLLCHAYRHQDTVGKFEFRGLYYMITFFIS